MKRHWWKIALLLVLLLGVGGGVALLVRQRSVPNRVRKLRERALIHMRLGELKQARDLIAQAHELMPSASEFTIRLAGLSAALGDDEAAERLLREGLERFPDDPAFVIQQVQLLRRQGRSQEAVSLVHERLDELRQIADAKTRAEVYLLAGQVLTGAGEFELAEELLREVVKIRSSHGLRKLATGDARVAGLLALGDLLQRTQRTSEAEQLLREGQREAPGAAQLNLLLAGVLRSQGRNAEGVELLYAFLRGSSERRLAVVPTLAQHLLQDGRVADVRALHEELSKDEKARSAACFVAGNLALLDEDLPAARAAYAELARLQPESPQGLLLLARVEQLSGDFAAARAALEQAEERGGSSDAQQQLLELDEREGRNDEAVERALALLAEPRARGRALRTLLVFHARQRRSPEVIARLKELLKGTPDDPTLALLSAVFEILNGDVERGSKRLLALQAQGEEALSAALQVLARAREGSADSLEAIELLADLASRDERLASARVVLADLFARLGQPGLAQRELDTALEADAKLEGARRARLQLALNQRRLDDAEADLSALLKAHPQDPQLRALLAGLRLQQGKPKEAIPLFSALVEEAPANARLLVQLGLAEARSGQLQRALATLARARRIDASLVAAHQDGAIQLALGNMDQALLALRRAAEKTRQPAFGRALAAAQALAGEHQQALTTLESVRPADAQQRIVAGLLLAQLGDRGRAQALLANVVPSALLSSFLAPRPRARLEPFLRSYAFMGLGWPELAQGALAERARDDLALAWWSGVAGGLKGSERIALARELAAAQPDDVRLGLELASAQAGAGDAQAELSTLEGLAERFPDDGRVALRLGMAQERAGQVASATAAYARAVAASPDDPISLNNLACMLGAEATQRSVALEHANRALALAPRVGPIYDTYGWLLFQEGRALEALSALRQAVSLAPRNRVQRYHLARVLDALGEPARALNQVRLSLLGLEEGAEAFAEQADARQLVERLAKELRLLSDAEQAKTLSAPGEIELKSDADGLAVVRLPAGSASFGFSGPSQGSALSLHPVGAPPARWEAGADLKLARLQLAEPCLLAIRTQAGSTCTITLGAAAEGPHEPDERPEEANALPAKGLSGSFLGPTDRDHLTLEAAEQARSLRVRAPGRYGLRADLLLRRGGRTAVVKTLRVARGGAAEIAHLVSPAEGQHLLRLVPAGAATGSAEHDYVVELAPAAGEAADLEPNDRPEEARPLALGEALSGELSPGERADWLRVAAQGELLSLRCEGAAGSRVLLWHESPLRRRTPLKAYRLEPVGEGGAGRLEVAHLRLPERGTLLLALSRAEEEGADAYRVELTPAKETAGAEVEPNDQAAVASALELEATGSGILHAADLDLWRLPAPPAGLLRLRVERDQEGPLGLRVFAEPDSGEPQLLGSYFTRGKELLLPALRCPKDAKRVLVVLGSGESVGGGYRLGVNAITPKASLEIEPNDRLSQAEVLRAGRKLTGHLSGDGDRDLFVARGRGVILTAKAPMTLVLWGEEPRQVAAGQRLALPIPAAGVTVELRSEGPAEYELRVGSPK